MGERQKPPSQLANRRGGRGRVLTVRRRTEDAPAPPEGLSEYATNRWTEFWESEAASAVDWASDAERLERWAKCLDQRERYWQLASAQPLLKSERGVTKNQLWTIIRQLTDEITRAEEHFGMTPLSRFRMQLTQAESENSVADLMRKLDEGAKRPGKGDRSTVIDLDDYEVS